MVLEVYPGTSGGEWGREEEGVGCVRGVIA